MMNRTRTHVPYAIGNLGGASLLGGNGAYDAMNNLYAARQQQDYEDSERERNQTLGRERQQWDRRVLTEDRGYDLDRERFGLEGEVARGRLGMQGNLANALAQALGQRQQFGGAMDVPPWMAQRGQMQAQDGQGMGLRDETRNYLMRFLKG